MRTRIRHVCAWPLSAWLVAAGLMLAAGCNNARFRQDQAVRNDRIRETVTWYADYSATGMDRAHQTMDLHRKLRGRHAEQLVTTTDLIRREHEYDVNRWYEQRPERRARLRGQWDGKPQNIPEAWANMIY